MPSFAPLLAALVVVLAGAGDTLQPSSPPELPAFTADMKVGENEAYYTALRFYGGAVAEDAAMTTFHLANGNGGPARCPSGLPTSRTGTRSG